MDTLNMPISTLPFMAKARIWLPATLLAPAMNGQMWQHPATQQHVATLKARGAQFIGPEAGRLACGYEGVGRLMSVERIVRRALQLVA